MSAFQISTPAEKLLLLRFSAFRALGDAERAKLRGVGARPQQSWQAGLCLPTQTVEGAFPRLLISGWAGSLRVLNNGRRQILSVFLPGDLIGLTDPASPVSATSVLALSPLRTVQAPELQLGRVDPSRDPGLAAALQAISAEQDFYLLGQIVRLGRQTAYERIANWLIEMDHRLSSRGLSDHGVFHFPLTQEVISDIVGLSVVHVNRTLQQMRREGFIELRNGRLSVLDRDALAKAGEFIAPPSPMRTNADATATSRPLSAAPAPAPA